LHCSIHAVISVLFTGSGAGQARNRDGRASATAQEVLAMEPAIIAICGVIAVIWVVSKTATAIRTLREQRRKSAGWERGSGDDGGSGVGGIDPGSSSHGGGNCGGHGGDSGGGW
jgi:hypothetical protein